MFAIHQWMIAGRLGRSTPNVFCDLTSWNELCVVYSLRYHVSVITLSNRIHLPPPPPLPFRPFFYVTSSANGWQYWLQRLELERVSVYSFC